MFICLDCGKIFEEPIHFTERHGLDSPPYEEYDGCPGCGGAFAETYRCSCCGEWITDDYIKTDDDKRYCSDCYQRFEIGGED